MDQVYRRYDSSYPSPYSMLSSLVYLQCHCWKWGTTVHPENLAGNQIWSKGRKQPNLNPPTLCYGIAPLTAWSLLGHMVSVFSPSNSSVFYRKPILHHHQKVEGRVQEQIHVSIYSHVFQVFLFFLLFNGLDRYG